MALNLKAAKTLPIGLYTLQLTDCEPKVSERTGGAYYVLTFKCADEDGPMAGYSGRTLGNQMLSDSEAAAFRVVEFIKAFGDDPDEMSDEEQENFSVAAYAKEHMNEYVKASVDNETQKEGAGAGELRAVISHFHPLSYEGAFVPGRKQRGAPRAEPVPDED